MGGRLHRSNQSMQNKHPVVLPRKGHVTDLVIHHFHAKVEHQGRGITTNEIRANGFWILGCSSAVSSVIYKCVKCRKIRGKCQIQKMADLPVDRLEPSPPFSYCAVDFFGPWYIKEGHKTLKRYGALFTCMSSRAVHINVANSMNTDSFLNTLRRFMAIRGPIRQLRSDQGTNFIGARNELKDALGELDQSKVTRFLSENGCDYFQFEFNVPHASHMGGVWERQFRTVRSILASMLDHSGAQLDEESIRTLTYEVSAIINSRPLTTNTLNDPTSLEPLTPNHLLTQKSKVLLPPAGVFEAPDVYSRKRWRRT